jgi:hypothetical protein
LAEIDVNCRWTGRTDCGEKVEGFEGWVDCFFEFLAVTGEEDSSCAGTVADADDITFMVEREWRM